MTEFHTKNFVNERTKNLLRLQIQTELKVEVNGFHNKSSLTMVK
jgi:hypothetical protein